MLSLYDLTCEYFADPIAIGTDKPRFSWKLKSDARDCLQTAYRLQVASDPRFVDIIWDSGKVQSSDSQLCEYSGDQSLRPDTDYYWRVCAEDGNRDKSEWASARFGTGILDIYGFTAQFIRSPLDKPEDSCAIYYRGGFKVSGELVRARAYVTALGMYDFYVNGQKVSDHYFAPGFISYDKRVLVDAYDILPLLTQGDNVAGGIVGNGWYKGPLVNSDNRYPFGKNTAFYAQLHLQYADGSVQVVNTGEDWQSGLGPITFSEVYNGETYDANLYDPMWCSQIDNGRFVSCEIEPLGDRVLQMSNGLPMREQEIIRPVEKIKTPAGEIVFDFAQNMVGFVRVRVTGNKGDRVRLSFAEVLDSDGNFYTDNMRSARNDIVYVLAGGGEEVFQPRFSFQGFRYMRVLEFPGFPQLENFEGVVIDTDMPYTGKFECSEPLINRLALNVRWGFMGNSVDVPTDCPQRDERLGWTGDAQVFIRTACFLRDTRAFYTKWLDDMALDQAEDGGIPNVVPDVLRHGGSACGWADAAVICPWTLYLCYGDKRLLRRHYPMMHKWTEHVHHIATKGVYWDSGFHFGDWLALDAKEGSYLGATPNDFTATAYYAYITSIMSQAADVLGYTAESGAYLRLHSDIVAYFRREFFTPNGRLAIPTQTAHVLALMFDLVPENSVQRTVDELVELIHKNDGAMTTGFLGTPYICYVLSRYGRFDEAVNLLTREEYPSWLYSVKKGATTIWEHWDGIKPDGSFWSDHMNSFNHYAYGCVLDWMVETLAGIDVDERMPGCKRFKVTPRMPDGWQHIDCAYESLYGKIAVYIKRAESGEAGSSYSVCLTVPENTTCVFSMGDVQRSFGSGEYQFTVTEE